MQHEVVISGTGTHGDILPMISLAAELGRRGVRSHVLASAGAEAEARRMGVAFAAVSPRQDNNLAPVEENFRGIVFRSYEPIIRHVRARLKAGARVLLVNRENYAASSLLAERHGLPLIRFALTPFRIPSLETPHFPWSRRMAGPLGRTFQRYVLPGLYERRYTQRERLAA